MNNLFRITACINKVNVANPNDCYLEIKDVLSSVDYTDSDILVFPRLALCSPSSSCLSSNPAVLDIAKARLIDLAKDTKQHKGFILVGLPIDDYGSAVSAVAVLNEGEVVALLPMQENSPYFKPSDFSYNFSDPKSVFSVGNLRCCVHNKPLDCIVEEAIAVSKNGCNLFIVPCYDNMYAGRIDELKALMQSISKDLNIAIMFVNGGVCDSSSPYLYNGFAFIYESGNLLGFESSFADPISLKVDIDLDILSHRAKSPIKISEPVFSISPLRKLGILKNIPQNPFLPQENVQKQKYLSELFDYQVQSLAARMRNTGIDKLVVGVSGGVDSTAALLVSVRACDILELPRTNIHGITMPGLGTSELTYYNALALLEALGVTRRDISIRAAVLQHFTDIGHLGNTDTTYENAQARERTQILLDIGNMVGGLVVGSGDLSEEALGFATFGGDHLASYNVNSCITKTVLKEILAFIASSSYYPEVSAIISDVLDTPVSPELLPPDADGNISQQTEVILGTYVLHEFFLYYFIAYNMPPSKIFSYASHAFRGVFNDYYIREKLELFIRKFCANQFKRSCAPDAANITEINLLGVNYHIPSDLDPSVLLNELKSQVH